MNSVQVSLLYSGCVTDLFVDVVKITEGTLCVKCKCNQAKIVVTQAAFCKYDRIRAFSSLTFSECFMIQAYLKYKTVVAKSRTRRDTPETVLVALSTGPASKLLLHMTQQTKNLEPKRQKLDAFIPVHIFDDDSTASDSSSLEELKIYVTSNDLVLISLPLSKVFEKSIELKSNLQANPVRLSHFLSSWKSASSQQSIRLLLRRLMLMRIAKDLNCTRVFLGDTGLRMAINTIADISEGRGMSLPWKSMLIQFSPLFPNIGIVRPLRDFQSNEVISYLALAKISCQQQQESLRSSETSTIYGLTDKFVTGLAQDFTATPTNVTRTALKVTTEASSSANSNGCCLCLCPLTSETDSFCYACQHLVSEVDASLLGEINL
jgi:hypothetical protein